MKILPVFFESSTSTIFPAHYLSHRSFPICRQSQAVVGRSHFESERVKVWGDVVS